MMKNLLQIKFQKKATQKYRCKVYKYFLRDLKSKYELLQDSNMVFILGGFWIKV